MSALPLTPLASRMVFADPLGANLAAGAAGVLAAVLIWHVVAQARRGRWAHWTCWSAAALAAVTLLWLVALLAGALADSPWTKLFLLALLAGGTVVVFYHTVYHYLGRLRVAVLLALRCLAIAVLVVMLFRPAWARGPARADRPRLVVLLDRSESMNQDDAASGPAGAPARTRMAAAIDALVEQREKLETYFDVSYYLFDRSAERVERWSDLTRARAAGTATCLDAALSAVRGELTAAGCQGAILISDGIDNSAAGPGAAVAAADSLPRPIFAVGVGGPVPEGAAGRDVAIERAAAPDQAVCNNLTAVRLDVRSAGYAGQPVTAVLRQVGGEDGELAHGQATLADGVVPLRLEFTPRATGVMELAVALEPKGGEVLAANNRHVLSVRVASPRIKVLYVAGSIRAENKYLIELLGSDPNVELMTLSQIRPPSAPSAGSGQGGDQPSAAVFTVRGTVGGKSLGTMPVTAEQFNLFDVFIFSDLDRTYLSESQMTFLRQAVSEQGKGLLMIGGSHSLGPGGFGGTPIEQVLPVTLGPRTIGQEYEPFRLQLTVAGKAHPIFAGLVNSISPPPEAPASQLPELSGCTKVASAKPSAQVLAVHPSRKTPDGAALLPVLAVSAPGAGRAAAFTADTTWRWERLRTIAAYEGVYKRFWSQMVRWLASSESAETKDQAAATFNMPRSFFAPGEEAPMAVRAWDSDGQPARDARVEVRLSVAGAPDVPGEDRTIVLQPDADEAGLYLGSFRADRSGAIALAMTARKGGRTLGQADRNVEVGKPGAEAARRSANLELLKDLAARKASRVPGYVPLAEYDRLVDRLVAPLERMRLAPAPQSNWPNYDRPYSPVYVLAMVLFVAVLSAEWLLRRLWQLN